MCYTRGLSVLLLAVVAVGCSGDNGAKTDSSDTGDVAEKETSKVVDAEVPPQVPDEPAAPPSETVLYLHADGSVTRATREGENLSSEDLRGMLKETVRQFDQRERREKNAGRSTSKSPSKDLAGLFGGRRVESDDNQVVLVDVPQEFEEIEEFEEELIEEITVVTEGWVPSGPTIKILAEPAATHGALDKLLKDCVAAGCERFELQNAEGGLSHAFALRLAAPSAGMPDPNQLPPIRLRLLADEDGVVKEMRIHRRPMQNLGHLRGYIVGLAGDQRGPMSIRENLELSMDCEAGLKLKHVFEALEAVTGYTGDDGQRVLLIDNVRPVAWGSPRPLVAEIDVSDVMWQPDTETIQEEVLNIEHRDPDAAAIEVELDPEGEWTEPRSDLLKEIGRYQGTGFRDRGAAARGEIIRQAGGNEHSEGAVGMALKWLANHQYSDGGWNFDHARCPACQGRCPNGGDLKEARRGATAMALLPFLAAGQTHMEGQHRDTVKKGLNYLVRSMKVRGDTASFEEPGGTMYSHGLATIALTEAYAMTRDKGLLRPAQLAVDHITYAQDPVDGGWRYKPKQPGDTSVTGWQVAALKSGHMAYLKVNPNTVKGAIRFLDSVQAANGAQYGYTGPATGRDATTAIGLLCRMQLGWKQDHPALQEGVKYISNKGPSKTNMYFNYYATQLMRHLEGDLWKKWNTELRDYLVNSQSPLDHAKGSWYFDSGDHGSSKGGRLYCTSLATLTLEVYYRHMPIFRKQAVQDDFLP